MNDINKNKKLIHTKSEDKNSDTFKKKFFLDNIAKYCDKCGTPYKLDDISIVQETGSSTIIHFSCQNCKSRNIANFISPLGLTTRIPINSDLSIDELPTFSKRSVISYDDILDVYTKLDDSHGFIEL